MNYQETAKKGFRIEINTRLLLVLIFSLALIILVLVLANLSGTISISQNTKDIRTINATVANSLNKSLSPILTPFANDIQSFQQSMELQNKTIQDAFNKIQIAQQASNNNLSNNVGSAISSLSSQANNITYTKEIATGMNQNIITLISLVKISINATRNISKNITVISLTNSLTTIPIYPTTKSIGTFGYMAGPLLPGFDNHIQFNATVPITLSVYSLSQFNLGNNQMQYNQWCQKSSSGNSNTISFWFNYTQQSQQNFVYMIYAQNTSQPFSIISNSTAKYNTTLINRENC